jgi:hypothetical protein
MNSHLHIPKKNSIINFFFFLGGRDLVQLPYSSTYDQDASQICDALQLLCRHRLVQFEGVTPTIQGGTLTTPTTKYICTELVRVDLLEGRWRACFKSTNLLLTVLTYFLLRKLRVNTDCSSNFNSNCQKYKYVWILNLQCIIYRLIPGRNERAVLKREQAEAPEKEYNSIPRNNSISRIVLA